MRYGVFGDVHGNLQALKEVVKAYRRERIDKYICVGDIVGYGAQPRESIEEVRRLAANTVCGNHDRAATGLFNTDYFNESARTAVEWTEGVLDREEKTFLKTLDLVSKEKDFSVTHGSLDRPDFFYYIKDKVSALRCFRNMEKDLCFVGHSHSPMIFSMEEDAVSHVPAGPFKVRPGVKHIVNVGSVGQPRDGDPRAAFCVFDTDSMTLEIKRVEYDVEETKGRILEAGLPGFLAHRLSEGR